MEALIDAIGTLPIAVAMVLMLVLAGACAVKAAKIIREMRGRK
jgi:hypothetical protein